MTTTASPKLRARSLGRADAASPDEVIRLRLINDADEPYDRPKTRADCARIPRPCPFVGCKHNLFLDYNRATGNIRWNFPNREPKDMPRAGSCALDVADQGGVTLNATGEMINLTRERVRQIETAALRKLRAPPTMGRTGNVLAESVAVLRAYADHQSDSGQASPLGEHMIESSSDASLEEDGDETHKVKSHLPHVLDPSVTDEEYCAALHRIWERQQSDRQALSQGDLHVVRGQYVTAKHVKVIEVIAASCRDRGQPPSIMEIADAAEIKGTPATRRQNVSTLLRSLRDLGLVDGKYGQLRVVGADLAPQEADVAAPNSPALPPEPRDILGDER